LRTFPQVVQVNFTIFRRKVSDNSYSAPQSQVNFGIGSPAEGSGQRGSAYAADRCQAIEF
jgi:hypothetical protein